MFAQDIIVQSQCRGGTVPVGQARSEQVRFVEIRRPVRHSGQLAVFECSDGRQGFDIVRGAVSDTFGNDPRLLKNSHIAFSGGSRKMHPSSKCN